MKYLYGNSAPSPLQSNFLAYVRDAMEFCVHLLLAQEQLTALRSDLSAREEHAAAERLRIDGLRMLVTEAAEAANTDGRDSMSRRAVDRVKTASAKAIEAILSELESNLAAVRAQLAAEEEGVRNGCLESFGQWVALHQPHEGAWKLSARLGENGHYEGETSGVAPYGIAWTYAIDLQPGHPMVNGSRVGDHVTQIELALPEPSGWLKKPKPRPNRIDDYSVNMFETDGNESTFALRAEPRGAAGIDVTIRDDRVLVTVAGAKEAMAVDVNEDNRERLLTLRDRVLDALTTHQDLRRRAVGATLDDAPLCGGEDLSVVAYCLINAAAPIVQQIRNHSLSPDELVIRRLLGNDQRVEIFVSTASLLEKVGRLPRHLRPVFAPLGLQWQRAQTPVPLPVAEPEIVIQDPELEQVSGEVVDASPSQPAPADSPPSVIVSSELTASDEAAGGGNGASRRLSVQRERREKFAIDARNKESLAATVKRIVAFARQGQTSEAYEAYSALFEDEDFAKQRPQDQRQVLKLMMKATTDSPPIEAVIQACRSALARLQALANETNDPTDQQLFSAYEELLASQESLGDQEARQKGARA